jgi:acetyl-CoA carboxylase carboxyl transferase subunit alpha
VSRIEEKAAQALKDLYAELTPWQKTQVARHPMRPHCVDYIKELITEFTPLAGDRKFGDDEALVGGFGRFRGESVCVIGRKRARPPRPGSSTISAWPSLKATARPFA